MARLAPKPPVARTTGVPSAGSSRSAERKWGVPAARVSVATRPSTSNRRPVVRGLSVSRSVTGAPSASSQSRSASRRSNTRRCSWGSPSGHSARKSSKRRWRQTTPLESRIDPPARGSFSSSRTTAPRRRACAAATRPAMPAPATIRSGMARTLLQREAGLVLDVLDADAVRAAHEDGQRVGGVLYVVDLPSVLLGLLLDRRGRVDEHGEVVEQLALALLAAAALEADDLVGDRGDAVAAVEAELGEPLGAHRGVGHAQDDVVEVVVEVVRILDEAHAQAAGSGEGHQAGARALEVDDGVAEAPGRRLEVVDAQDDALEHARVARALGVEERELAAAGIGADEGEVVGALDLVRAGAIEQESGQGRPLVGPEGDVVEGPQLGNSSCPTGRDRSLDGVTAPSWPSMSLYSCTRSLNAFSGSGTPSASSRATASGEGLSTVVVARIAKKPTARVAIAWMATATASSHHEPVMTEQRAPITIAAARVMPISVRLPARKALSGSPCSTSRRGRCPSGTSTRSEPTASRSSSLSTRLASGHSSGSSK